MRWQSALSIGLLVGGLSACGTLDFKDAEPEKYAAYDCEQLDQLAESYRDQSQVSLFNDGDISELERRGESNDGIRPGATKRGDRPYEIEWARDQRSIALARREKGCL